MGNVVCCSTRDINDQTQDIESRNDQFFYFNYPSLLKEIDKRLADCEGQPGRPTGSDVNYFKWVLSQLLLEIDYNQKNLEVEHQQQSAKKRLAIEIQNAEFKRQQHQLGKCKMLIRMQYKQSQKQTKKNVNSYNPKFYEFFKFPLEVTYLSDDIKIYIIMIDKNEEWHLCAKTKIKIDEFSDQLVHMQFLNIPVLNTPIKVVSDRFKFNREISEFSFEEESMEPHFKPIELMKSQMSLDRFNPEAIKYGEGNDDTHLRAGNNTLEDDISMNFIEEKRFINQHGQEIEPIEKSNIDDSEGSFWNFDENDEKLFSKEIIKISIRIQLLTDSTGYLKGYIEEYQDKFHHIQKFLDDQNIFLD